MTLSLPSGARRAIHILGYVAGYAAGAALVLHGALVTGLAVEIMWGGIVLAAVTVALIGGAMASPRGRISPPTVGARFTRIPDRAWYVIAALVVLGAVLTFVLPR